MAHKRVCVAIEIDLFTTQSTTGRLRVTSTMRHNTTPTLLALALLLVLFCLCLVQAIPDEYDGFLRT